MASRMQPVPRRTSGQAKLPAGSERIPAGHTPSDTLYPQAAAAQVASAQNSHPVNTDNAATRCQAPHRSSARSLVGGGVGAASEASQHRTTVSPALPRAAPSAPISAWQAKKPRRRPLPHRDHRCFERFSSGDGSGVILDKEGHISPTTTWLPRIFQRSIHH